MAGKSVCSEVILFTVISFALKIVIFDFYEMTNKASNNTVIIMNLLEWQFIATELQIIILKITYT